MNPEWDKRKAKQKIKAIPNTMVCDTLLHQDIFGGVGNIIKNEVLYRIRVHPESINAGLSDYKLNLLIRKPGNIVLIFWPGKRIMSCVNIG
jgi:endonuclease-8